MDMDNEAFVQSIVDAHNERRRTHGVRDLRHSPQLDAMAQNWADKLAEQQHISYSELSGIGENITFFPRDLDPNTMVEHWYGEHEKYEYETPGWQTGTNYFTQVVWKSTQEIGVGRAFIDLKRNGADSNQSDPGLEQVVVVFYRPAGNNNRAGQFAVNVSKPIVGSTS